jgi:hypothetical protein
MYSVITICSIEDRIVLSPSFRMTLGSSTGHTCNFQCVCLICDVALCVVHSLFLLALEIYLRITVIY